MTRDELFSFETYIMDLCEQEGCKIAENYEDLSQQLHESIETAILEMCLDEGIEDYEPSY